MAWLDKIHHPERYIKTFFKWAFLGILMGAIGGLLSVGIYRLFRLKKNRGTNEIIDAVLDGEELNPLIAPVIFLATAITLAAGFKGGEIVPTFCIGATFGCVASDLLGLDPGLAAALGLVGLFCCATNSPLASIVLSIEMFSGANIHLFALVCVICFVLSGNSSLYASQIIQFSKSSTVQSAREPQSTDSQGDKS